MTENELLQQVKDGALATRFDEAKIRLKEDEDERLQKGGKEKRTGSYPSENDRS